MHHLIDPALRLALGKDSCALVMMAKVPRIGTVKTRLTPLLNDEQAATLSRCFIRDMAANIGGLTRDRRLIGVVAYTPAGEESAFVGLLPSQFHLLTQRGADLGERLSHAAEDLFAAGFCAVCLINSDSPTLPQSILSQAAAELRFSGERIVLGEASDGGYYLIGLKKPLPHLFHRIDWSTPRVSAQTAARADEIKVNIARLPTWYDVDDWPSLQMLFQELLKPNGPSSQGPASGYRAPFTSRFLRRLAVENRTVGQLLAEMLPELRVN
jgi:rSAM/selenodomain-associated transferase 1